MDITIFVEWVRIPALIGAGILGIYTTLNIADRIYRFFIERRLKHFERAISYLKKDEASDDLEYPLYVEGLRQELFMLAFGMRKPRRFREELLAVSESGEINFVDIADLGSDTLKFDNDRLIVKPNRWWLAFGWSMILFVSPIALAPIFRFSDDASNLPFGVLIMFISGAVSGAGIGIIGRTTIRPYLLAKKFKVILDSYYGNKSVKITSAE